MLEQEERDEGKVYLVSVYFWLLTMQITNFIHVTRTNRENGIIGEDYICAPLSFACFFCSAFSPRDMVLSQTFWVSVVTKECDLDKFLTLKQEELLGTEHCKRKKIDSKCL